MSEGPLEFLRGLLGLMCVLFAHMAGRSSVATRKGWQPRSRLVAWVLRAVVCAVAVGFRHPADAIAIAVWLLGAAAFGAGAWIVARQKPPEDLAGSIFPDSGPSGS